MSQPKRRTVLAARVRVPTRGTKFKEAASLDAAFCVLKRLVYTKPISQPKNRTLLCPMPYALCLVQIKKATNESVAYLILRPQVNRKIIGTLQSLFMLYYR